MCFLVLQPRWQEENGRSLLETPDWTPAPRRRYLEPAEEGRSAGVRAAQLAGGGTAAPFGHSRSHPQGARCLPCCHEAACVSKASWPRLTAMEADAGGAGWPGCPWDCFPPSASVLFRPALCFNLCPGFVYRPVSTYVQALSIVLFQSTSWLCLSSCFQSRFVFGQRPVLCDALFSPSTFISNLIRIPIVMASLSWLPPVFSGLPHLAFLKKIKKGVDRNGEVV